MDVIKDYKQAITCPYCFRTFSHQEVHFRMESYFDENNLNEEGYLEEDLDDLLESEDKEKLVRQTRERMPFMIREDPLYTKWWSRYGKTTERAYGLDEKLPCQAFELPVLNPGDPEDQKSLTPLHPEKEGVDRYLRLDADNMAVSVVDRFGEETRRRVCPHCHNPLPIHYGKSQTWFISVIGITGSGKTVYLSQLMKLMADYVAMLKMSANPTTDVENFIKSNPVLAGKPLPPASVEGCFSQPMVYDLSRELTNTFIQTETIVLYDIAGEDCQSPKAMEKYGKFVQHSDGIILLVDPQKQLDLRSDDDDDSQEEGIKTEPQIVLQTIHNVFLNLPKEEKCKTPLAVCVSKSDSFLSFLGNASEIAKCDIAEIKDDYGVIIPEFNATEYNKLNQKVKALIKGKLAADLSVGYLSYNFFAFSATGGPVELRKDENGVTYKYLKGPATPKRIAEPLFWLFYKFGFIRPNEPILLPEPRKWEKRYSVNVRASLIPIVGTFMGTKTETKMESAMTDRDWKSSPPPQEILPTAEELDRLRYEEY